MTMASDTSDGCVYNYVVTAHPPSAVSRSVVGSFRSANEVNLIVAKTTRLEIHRLTAEGLEGLLDVPVYGRIASLLLFRPAVGDKDLLFMHTEKCKFCILTYDLESEQLQTVATGDLSDAIAKPSDLGQLAVIDPQARIICLHLYVGMLKVLPLTETGQVGEPFTVRMDHSHVLDLQLLHGYSQPTLAVLYEDVKGYRNIQAKRLDLPDQDIGEEEWQQENLDPGAHKVIPVPGPLGGAIVLGESIITYFNSQQAPVACQMNQTVMRSWGRIDEDGSRFLLGDYMGRLYLLVLSHDSKHVLGLKLQPLGMTSITSTISYLDNGYVYIGSLQNDSQLVKLHSQPVKPDEQNNYTEVLENFNNLGPIVDCKFVDLDRSGQGQLVTCSGTFQSGCLKLVRNGIGITEQAAVELPGIRGVWSLQAASGDEFDTFLVLTFVGETRVLALSQDDELDEAELPGFDGNTMTLLCLNAEHNQLVQVTTTEVRLVACDSLKLVSSWTPEQQGARINLAAGTASQLLLSTGGSCLTLLHLGAGSLEPTSSITISSEVACIDIQAASQEGGSQLAAVGTWERQLQLHELPSLMLLSTLDLSAEVIPRSVLFMRFEDVLYLLLGMGDGALIHWQVSPAGNLTEQRTIPLGTKPITLRKFTSKDMSYAFAACDRPTVMHSKNRKLQYSNLNETDVAWLCSFNSRTFPDSLAIAKEHGLMVGLIDDIQLLHIRSVPLRGQPRRLAHQPSTRTFGVLVLAYPETRPGELQEMTQLHILDDTTWEVVAQFQLEANEMGSSTESLVFAGSDNQQAQAYYVVGTAYVDDAEPEPTKGRLIVLSYDPEAKPALDVVYEREIPGAAYCIKEFQGKLLATVNNRVFLFGWERLHSAGDGAASNSERGHAWELKQECAHKGDVLSLFLDTRGDFILLGDLMRSMSLLLYKSQEQQMEERARDLYPNWMTAVSVLDDDTFMGAENSYNLFTLSKNSDAAADEDRLRLATVGRFHLGEMINCFRPGSLVMQLPDSFWANKMWVFGTVSGMIGVVVSLPQSLFQKLEKLQSVMRSVVKGVGGFDHEEWREWMNEGKKQPCRGFIDGDLVELFLDLPQAKMEEVAASLGPDTSLTEMYRLVEDLSRLH